MLEQTLLLEATLYLSAGTANHDQTRRSASRSGQGRSIAFDKFRSYNYFQCHFALLRAQLNCARRSRMPINSETSPAATCAISTWRQVGMQHKSGSGGANWRCMVYADHRTHLLAEDVWAWCHPGSLPCNCKRNRPASLVAHCVSGPRPASPPHFPLSLRQPHQPARILTNQGQADVDGVQAREKRWGEREEGGSERIGACSTAWQPHQAAHTIPPSRPALVPPGTAHAHRPGEQRRTLKWSMPWGGWVKLGGE